ncbi:glycosyltransferase [Coraliomargarita sp. SDUM461003]|uniref:Glycosyltransferase n=1 Tax=Thalassobacterium maritimum TaxID=3041265 RepID=A0ABU1AX94_9BACT|nr:glycosyltransferase [Coraliomargarita sp. SDUM461003]MDQ8208217.1 glycosyltransferase [Coraliomargarita sp. SDUM461003]
MRIGIVVSNFRYPPSEGIEVQLIDLVNYFRAEGHEVDIIALESRGAETCKKKIFSLGDGVLFKTRFSYKIQAMISIIHLLTGGVSVSFFPRDREIRARVRKWLNNKDSIYIQGVALAWIPSLIRSNHIVWGPVDAYSLRSIRIAKYLKFTGIYKRLLSSIEKRACLFLESRAIRSSKYTYVCGFEDARFLSLMHRSNSIRSIPLLGMADVINSSEIKRYTNRRVVLWADFRINYLFRSGLKCLDVLSESCQKIGLELIILGQGSADLCREFGENRAPVHFLEWVEDLDSYLSESVAIVLPDEVGTGIKNRAIYAMGSGCVVLGKSAAFQSIPAISRSHCIQLNSWSKLEDELNYILDSFSESARIRSNAALLIEDYNSSSKIIKSWEQLLSPTN